MKKKLTKPQTIVAWAWEMKDRNDKWALCKWAEPFKATLDLENKPSPEARKVCVRLIRNTDYIKAGLRSRSNPKK